MMGFRTLPRHFFAVAAAKQPASKSIRAEFVRRQTTDSLAGARDFRGQRAESTALDRIVRGGASFR